MTRFAVPAVVFFIRQEHRLLRYRDAGLIAEDPCSGGISSAEHGQGQRSDEHRLRHECYHLLGMTAGVLICSTQHKHGD